MTEYFQIYKLAFIAGKKLVEIKHRSFNSYDISPLNKDKCIIQDGKLMLTVLQSISISHGLPVYFGRLHRTAPQ